MKILEMVSNGKLTVEEAELLFEALGPELVIEQEEDAEQFESVEEAEFLFEAFDEDESFEQTEREATFATATRSYTTTPPVRPVPPVTPVPPTPPTPP
ncbi:hypothetical protein L0337_10415, partial [candidate division KSB1 bacterium]|nr:hypothetical protein [candidate division KSB1 bacterium]